MPNYAAAVLGPLLGAFAASALQVDHVPFDMTWTGDGSVDTWDTVSKWSGGALPLPCATITVQGQLNIPTDQTVDDLIIEPNSDFNLDAGVEFSLEVNTEATCCDDLIAQGVGYELDLSGRQCKVASAYPTASPTKAPTAYPTASPTKAPTAYPTAYPTASPTKAPTAYPTASPTKAPTAYPTAYPTASPTKAPTAYPTAYPTASPTWAPTFRFDNEYHYSYCPVGFIYAPVTDESPDNIDSYDLPANYTFNDQTNVTMTCHKCGRGFSSGGGLQTSCHKISREWSPCTHVGCKLTKEQGCTTAHHHSANPRLDLANNVSLTQTFANTTHCNTAGSVVAGDTGIWYKEGHSDAIERLVVFHHGFEGNGTVHRCSLSGTRADAVRSCSCMCRNTQGEVDDLHPGTHENVVDQTKHNGTNKTRYVHRTARSWKDGAAGQQSD